MNLLKSVGEPSSRVSIDLDKQTRGIGNTYTTSDRVEGTVAMAVDSETRFSDVNITFEGNAQQTLCSSKKHADK